MIPMHTNIMSFILASRSKCSAIPINIALMKIKTNEIFLIFLSSLIKLITLGIPNENKSPSINSLPLRNKAAGTINEIDVKPNTHKED